MALLLSGFFAILAVWKYGVDRVRTELINESAELRMGFYWTIVLRYVSPLIFVGLTGWWFYQGIVDNLGTWWNLFATFTTGTILL